MRFNKLDLNLLVALDALLAERSVSRAAERVHLSQSAMSNALARLREHFADELLVQIGRRMDLTPRAEVLVDAVRDVLVRIDATVSAQPLFDPAASDRDFRILVSDYSMVTLMPHVLALAHQQGPNVRFKLLPQAADPQRALDRGEADLLIIPKQYCAPDHPLDVVVEEAFSCVVWSGSRWATQGLTLAGYASAGHVAVQPNGLPVAAVERWFEEQQAMKRRVEVTTYSFASHAALVVGTDRIATLHHRQAMQAANWLPVQVLPPPLPIAPMQQCMQWHQYRTQDAGLLWLRGLMHRAAQRMDADHSPPSGAAPTA
jgi:DNA-binding transcriptional LysR family regulator